MAHPNQRTGLNFRKRVKQVKTDPKLDDRLKRAWLKENQIKKLPPGWSRYGYGPT
jgi:hypothetical protein